MDEKYLFPGVGIYAKVNHICVRTASDKLYTAILFLRKLGYETETTETYLGMSITMVKEGGIPIQLGASSDSLQVLSNENHIGIVVDDPERVWQGIRKWAGENELSVDMVQDLRGTMYVSIPEVLSQVFELVTNPNSCPGCRATGTVVLGCEGQPYETYCFICDGDKYIKK